MFLIKPKEVSLVVFVETCGFIDVDAAIKDPRLSFEVLRFLGALLCDTKFAVDFLYGQGLHRLIEVPRSSIVAAGVAMCFYHIARHIEPLTFAMTCCMINKPRHVSGTLKGYFEIHLAWKEEHLRRRSIRKIGGTPRPPLPHYKVFKLGTDPFHNIIKSAKALLPFPYKLRPVDEFICLGGIPLLLQILTISRKWDLIGRAEYPTCPGCFECVLSIGPRQITTL